MMTERLNQRKQRSDKKTAIAPFVPEVYKVWIQRISHVLNISEGEVGALLISTAIQDEECLRFFSSFYKRDYTVGNITFMGHKDAIRIEEYFDTTDYRERFKIRVNKEINHKLCEFQIALGTSFLSHATHALLKYALHKESMLKGIAPGLDRQAMLFNAQPLGEQSHVVIQSPYTAPAVIVEHNVTEILHTNAVSTKNSVINQDTSHSVWSVLHRKGGK